MSNSARALPLRRTCLVAVVVAAMLVPVVPGNALAQPLEPGRPASDKPSSEIDLSIGSSGEWHFNKTERCFLARVNRRRARRGLSRLEWDRQVGFIGRRHAYRLARAGGLWHDQQLGNKITNWVALAQNTGRSDPGRRCKGLFRSFWNSYYHRQNMLGSWRYMGIGAVRQNRRLYVQMVFESQRNPGNIYQRP